MTESQGSKKYHQDKRYREKNKEILKAKKAQYYLDNKERIALKAKESYALNPEPAKIRASKWKKDNAVLVNATCMKRYTLKRNRYLKGHEELTDLVAIEAYDKAKKLESITGFKWHVDHIVPLQGKTVSGLHIWSNLSVIPASINTSKRADYWPDM